MDTVAVKCAEDAQHWGVHLSAAHRELMDALVERLVALHAGGRCQADEPEALFRLGCEADTQVQALQAQLHFRWAAKRYGFFLQYLRDALRAEAARRGRQAV